jgi:hypothetical protein
MGTGIVSVPYGGGQGYQFRLAGNEFNRSFPEGTEGVVTAAADLELISSLIHRRVYFGFAGGVRDQTDSYTILLYVNGTLTFFRQDREVGQLPISWGNDPAVAAGAGGGPFNPQPTGPAWAVEPLGEGMQNFPETPPHEVAQNALLLALPSLNRTPDTQGRNAKASLRLYPYHVTVEADRAELKLQYAVYFTSNLPQTYYVRGWWGVYSQDHPV